MVIISGPKPQTIEVADLERASKIAEAADEEDKPVARKALGRAIWRLSAVPWDSKYVVCTLSDTSCSAAVQYLLEVESNE